MFKFLTQLFEKKKDPAQPKSQTMPLDTSDDVTAFFGELFKGHGMAVTMRDGWVIADNGCLIAQARFLLHNPTPGQFSVQLDFEVRSPRNPAILESCAGWGNSPREAIVTAIKRMSEGSFHVIFCALSGLHCSHCEIEEWVIAGKKRRVYLGPLSLMQAPKSVEMGAATTEIFPLFQRELEALPLSGGLHFIRFFHAESAPDATSTEVLVDGEPHIAIQDTLAKYAWTPTTGYYSLRLFLIIVDA